MYVLTVCVCFGAKSFNFTNKEFFNFRINSHWWLCCQCKSFWTFHKNWSQLSLCAHWTSDSKELNVSKWHKILDAFRKSVTILQMPQHKLCRNLRLWFVITNGSWMRNRRACIESCRHGTNGLVCIYTFLNAVCSFLCTYFSNECYEGHL